MDLWTWLKPKKKNVPAGDAEAFKVAEAAIGAGHYPAALAKLRPLAEAGDHRAQFSMGQLYANGLGVARDLCLAMDWFRKAAEQGNAAAQTAVAMSYHLGRGGLPMDHKLAAEWHVKAAEQGYAGAQLNLAKAFFEGLGVHKDFGKGIYWLRKAAEQGLAEAEFSLANMYGTGTDVVQDHAQAAYSAPS